MAAVTTRRARTFCPPRVISTSPTQADADNVAWGYNPSALTAAATDWALFEECAETGVAGSSSQVTITTVYPTFKVTAGSGTTALTALRGQNASTAIASIATGDPVTAGKVPGSTATAGGSWLLHADHSAHALNSGHSIAYTIKIHFT